MNIANIGVGVYADLARLNSGLREGQSAVAAFAGAAATAFGAAATAAVAAGLTIDDALDGIRISTGATGEALKGLEASFDRVFANVPDSAADASAAVTQLNVRTGQTGAGLEALSTQVLTLARITKSDLNSTVVDSTKVFESWRIEASKQPGTLDMVLRAHQQTGIAVGSLLQTMVTAGPVFRAAGFDFATSAALLGSFEKAGVNGQRAVASMTAAFRFFSKEGIDAKEGVAQTIARIQELGPGAASAALGVKVFGRSAVDMVAAIQSGRLNVDALVASIANGSDTIASAAQATDGFNETLAKLRNNAVLALEPFGTAVLATFNAAMVAVLAPSRALLGTLNLLAQASIALAAATSAKLVVSLVAATRAKIASIAADQAARVAAVQKTAADVAQARANVAGAVAQVQMARATTGATGSMTAQRTALVGLRAAHAQATAATAAHTAAMNAASWSARLAAGSMNILKGALAFFGGPIGLAITAVLTVVGIAFFNAGRKAREAAAEARHAADEFRAALAGMDEATLGAVGRTQRYNYGILQRAAAQQQANIDRQQAIVDSLRQAEPQVSASGSGFVRISRELDEAQRALARQQDALKAINTQWVGIASNVRAVREQEAAMARQSAAMEEANKKALTGSLGWEGASAAADALRDADQMRNRVSALTEVYQAQAAQGINTASVMSELNRIYDDAATRLRAMGDATRLPADSLKDYQAYLSVVRQLGEANIAGPAAVRQAPAAAQVGRIRAVEQGMSIVISSGNRFASITKRGAEDFGQIIVGKLEQGRAAVKSGLEEGARTAADRLKEASAEIRGMWSGLLEGLPQQLRDFTSMFSALKEKRAAQVGAGAPVTGLAPVPGALAFMLAAEALAPVLEAIREPMQALLVPIQMVAAAFGPLLTSLIKALFPIFKQFGISVTYVAQVAGYVAGALLKVVGEIIRTVGSLVAKVPGLGQEGAAIKKFGKGLVDSSKEMFAMARSMPAVRDELRALDWDEAMSRATESANKLADSLTNVPEVFNLIARQTQAMRGQGPQNVQAAASVSLNMQAVAESVSVAAASAGTTAAKAVTAEAAQWKAALVEGAVLASQTLAGAATELRGVLAGIVAETPRQARALNGGARSIAGILDGLRDHVAKRSVSAPGALRPLDLAPTPAPSPSSQRDTGPAEQVIVNVAANAFPIVGASKEEVEAQIRALPERIGKYLAEELNRPGTSKFKAAVQGAAVR